MKRGFFLNEGGDGGTGGDDAATTAAAEAAKQEQINATINTVTGGKYQDATTFQEFFNNFENNFVLKTELEKFNDYIPKDKRFANPFVQEINALVENNAPQEHIELFVDLSLKDLEKMDANDAIVRKMVLEKGLSMSDAKLLVSDEYPTNIKEFMLKKGLDPNEPDDVAKAEKDFNLLQVRAKMEGNTAKQFLSEKKKSVFEGITSAEEKRKQAEAQNTERIKNIEANWLSNKELPSMIATDLKVIPVSVKDTEANIDYSIEIPMSAKFLETAVQTAQAYAVHNQIDPTPENVKEIVELLKQDYILKNFNSIAETLVRDATAKATKKKVDDKSNNGGDGNRNEGGNNGGDTPKKEGFYKRS